VPFSLNAKLAAHQGDMQILRLTKVWQRLDKKW